MTKSLKIFQLLSYQFLGFTGSVKQLQKIKYPFRILSFGLRYGFFLTVLFFIFQKIGIFIEAPLLNIAQKIMFLSLDLPIHPLQLGLNDQLFMKIPPLEYIPQRDRLPAAFCLLLPLILATSANTIKEKLKMVLTGIIALSLIEIVFIILAVYGWLFTIYPLCSQKGLDLYPVIGYPETGVSYFLLIYGFLKKIHPILILSIWISVAYMYKKTNSIIDAIL